ncbi:type IV toxin-antitoxin system AbiEi family antitoxin domain-containing protein [bacterium]|nr:type IV toxin-antitoxin system AbiEi family antitoxin domain-containing protein [candidate division CSSED10-310 bacterium]
MAKNNKQEIILELIKKYGVLRPKDLDKHGIPRRYLSLMRHKGLLVRSSRGLYELPDADVSENYTLSLVSKRIPRGVGCLLTALRFHNLTTEQPNEIWMAVERSMNPNFRMDDLPVRIVRMSGVSFSEGIENHYVDGIPIRIYSIPKTIADCFKFRNRIGLDVALEVLKECRQEKRCTNEEIWYFAKICRVARIMRPYLEAIF